MSLDSFLDECQIAMDKLERGSWFDKTASIENLIHLGKEHLSEVKLDIAARLENILVNGFLEIVGAKTLTKTSINRFESMDLMFIDVEIAHTAYCRAWLMGVELLKKV